MKPETEKSIIHCLLITLATFIPYHQVATHRFIEFDDGIYAFLNKYIIQGMTWESIVWSFTNTVTANWHPLTWITHLVDREMFGQYPGGYLLMNVAWHTVAACLCYLAFTRVTANRLMALAIALIFALHPANVENVAWASERKSMVDAVFWFLGALAYFEHLEKRNFKSYGILFITHCLGLMGKPMHVTFPCAMVLLHLLAEVSRNGGRGLTLLQYRAAIIDSLRVVWPLLALTIYFSLVTASAQKLAMSPMEIHPLAGRLVNVLQSYQKYILMFFNPQELAPFYPLFYTEQVFSKAIVPLILLTSATSVLGFCAWKGRPIALIGWFWFLGTMVPVIGLVQVGAQSHADRYLYIPMIGLAFMVPELFAWMDRSRQRSHVLFHQIWLGLAAVSLIIATHIQVSYWKNGVTLFQHSLRVTGDCITAVNCLTSGFIRNQQFKELILYLDLKIPIATSKANIAKFHATQATAYFNLNKPDDCIKSCVKAIDLGHEDANCFLMLAMSYTHKQEYTKAKEAIKMGQTHLTSTNTWNTFHNEVRLMLEAVKLDLSTRTPADGK